jgi:sugar-specific transcriptional regulator TrmB
MQLLRSADITAKKLSENSGVPTGRIYEVLEELKNKGMIEIQDSRPKKYRSLPFNSAFQNLIAYLNKKSKDEISYLYDQAKILETKIYNSDMFIKKEATKTFWSTSFGANSILALYAKKLDELQEELLMTGFINKTTLTVLPYGKDIYNGIQNALKRGVQVKYLWSFEHDDRPLSNELEAYCADLYLKLTQNLKTLFNLSLDSGGFEMKYIYRRFPSYFDLFDNKRVLFKLQYPSLPSHIFACINVLDSKLADELRKTFLNTWIFEAIH